MTEFVIHLSGDRGTLLVDGEQPELFGQLVGCEVRRDLPLQQHLPQPSSIDVITPLPAPTVEVTLRLPLGMNDHVTLVRDTTVQGVHGPSGDYIATRRSDTLRARVKDWLEDADTWDMWPTIETAILGVLDATAIADVTDWQRGYRAAADNARRAIASALGVEVDGG